MNLNFLKNEKLRVMHKTLKEKFNAQTAQIVFLEWKNNWLTVDAMAEHYKCNVPILYEIIAEGNRQNEAMAKQIKESEISPRKKELFGEGIEFSQAKTKVHDASGIENPNDYLWILRGGIFYPNMATYSKPLIQDTKEEEKVNAWDFVEKYYPNYSSCQSIADSNDLQKIVDGEINGCAIKVFNEYIERHNAERKQKLPLIEEDHDEGIVPDNWEDVYKDELKAINYERDAIDKDIYEKAIKSFLEQQKIKEETTATITWSVKDFTDKAKDIFEDMEEHEKNGAETWQEYFDESKFPEALKGMIEDSDQEYGTTWGSVEYWLNENCKIKR